jgi:hypothetical protein
MKKIFFITVSILTAQFAQSQLHEVGISRGTGISTLLYKGTSIDASVKVGAGFVLSFDYIYNFRPNWGLSTGVSFLYAQQKVKSNSVSESVAQTYIFDVPTKLLLNSMLKNWSEKQNSLFIQIPIMARYQSTLDGKTQYYISIGGKVGFNVLNDYVARADMLTTSGNFDKFRQVFNNVPNHNFITINDVKYNGRSPNFVADFSVAFEAGAKWAIGSRNCLYAGLFCEYGLTNLNGGNRYDAANIENTLISYQPDNTGMFSYSGLFQTNITKDNRVNLFSIGLKVRFTFCLGKRLTASGGKTMFGSKTVRYKSEKYSSGASIR